MLAQCDASSHYRFIYGSVRSGVRCWFQGASILENVYFYSQRKVSEELTKSISDENKLSFEVVMLSRNYTFS